MLDISEAPRNRSDTSRHATIHVNTTQRDAVLAKAVSTEGPEAFWTETLNQGLAVLAQERQGEASRTAPDGATRGVREWGEKSDASG